MYIKTGSGILLARLLLSLLREMLQTPDREKITHLAPKEMGFWGCVGAQVGGNRLHGVLQN
jgi:hypothetical protein